MMSVQARVIVSSIEAGLSGGEERLLIDAELRFQFGLEATTGDGCALEFGSVWND